MKKLVVYCHGYGSSPNTDKVQKLRDAGLEVLAVDLSGTHDEALERADTEIANFVMDNLSELASKFIVVGTSLGAYFAHVLGKMWYADEIFLINPCMSPRTFIPMVQPDGGYEKAEDIKINIISDKLLHTVFVAENDELFDFSETDFGDAHVIRTKTGGHRYNGQEFDAVIKHILEA